MARDHARPASFYLSEPELTPEALATAHANLEYLIDGGDPDDDEIARLLCPARDAVAAMLRRVAS